MDVCLHQFGQCNFVSAKHACIFFDEVTLHFLSFFLPFLSFFLFFLFFLSFFLCARCERSRMFAPYLTNDSKHRVADQ